MNPATHLSHPRARGMYPRRWYAALAMAALFAFALPGVASASEGGFRHNVLMRGQVLEKQNETLVVCVGQADGAQVGQVLDVIRHKRGLNAGKAVKDVTFEVRKGEILGFAGLMGAGRTEVARAIFGADKLDSGEIEVHGKRAKIKTPTDAVRLGLAYLSEDRKQFGIVTRMSVRDNITMPSWSRFASAGFWMRDRDLAKTAAKYVDLLKVKTPSVDQETRLLSGGNQQKVVISKWLLRNCDVLFFDEPTRGIDVGAKAEIYRLLQGLADEGKAIVVISSELEEILRLSRRILVMCEGRITGEIDGTAATQEAIMHLATQRQVNQGQAEAA